MLIFDDLKQNYENLIYITNDSANVFTFHDSIVL